ncbi:MAG: nucleotide exchange factor GrpE [Caulobacteraceae bacterium]|nr:nucleotide exchange factor GrpE [Caulobacteraceae bacterium]
MTDDTAANGYDGEEDAPGDDALTRAEGELAALKDQLLRIAADAENTRRRAEREANDARAFAIQKFARDLLGVADNLQRALQHAPRDSVDGPLKNLVVGLEMTEKELQGAFERNGLKRVEPERGDKFDPHLHQAMMEQPAEDVAPGAVIQVMQPGYELMGRIVRPAMVVVAAKGSGARAAPSAPVQDESAQSSAGGYAPVGDDAGGSIDTKA